MTRIGVRAVLSAAAWGMIAVAPVRAGDIQVKINNFTFNPPELTVKTGTTITWTNEDDIPHTISSDTQKFKSKALDTNDKFSFTFGTPGTYKYFCSLHPHMVGSIMVEAATDKSGS